MMPNMMMMPQMMDPANLPLCAQCGQAIMGPCLNAINKRFHPEHFVCASCFSPLANQQYFEADGRPYCANCFQVFNFVIVAI